MKRIGLSGGALAALAALAFLLLPGVATAAAPTVVTGNASSVSTTSARLNGTVDPNGEATSWYFEFGTTTSYGTKTATLSAGSGQNPTNVGSNLSGLTAATTYHYRLVASNASGTTLGADRTFTTEGPPAVVTGAAQNVTPTSVTLTGTVDPRGRSTSWRFEYGTSTSYGTRTSSRGAGSGFGAVGVNESISGLAPGTTYHFRLIASSSAGNAAGADGSFTTPVAVTIARSGDRVVAGRFVHLSGTVFGGQAGVSVTVLAQPFGTSSFAPVATVLTGGGGSWSYLAQPRIGTSYQATAGGGTSSTVSVGVQPAMTLRLITKARFATRVSGASGFPGRFVKLQRLSGDRWVTVKQARLNGNSIAIFPASALPHGRSTIRVAMSVNQAGPGYLGGKSRQLVYTRR